jgi:hypothetical protein
MDFSMKDKLLINLELCKKLIKNIHKTQKSQEKFNLMKSNNLERF